MNIIEVILIGIGLSMDALAVSLALGAVEKKNFTWNRIFWTAFFFGVFQAVMPMLGWCGGTLFGEITHACGKYVAAILLFWVGGKMIYDSKDEEKVTFSWKQLTILAFATSIDALLVGVGFACLDKTPAVVLSSSILIGITTFLISIAGCIAGRISGNLFGNKCNIAGGIVLIGIGIKMLIFG